MASEILQVMFLGITGFHYHVAHYAVAGATASQISTTIWKCVDKLAEWEFEVSSKIYVNLVVYQNCFSHCYFFCDAMKTIVHRDY